MGALGLAAFFIAQGSAGSSAQGRVYATGAGERTTVMLADGSRITVAPRSRVAIPADFGRTTRTISLTGEAYFDVQPGAAVPFVVSTERASAQVLGTRFVVRQYHDDRRTFIAVNEGRVQLRAGAASVILDAGAMAEATDSTATLTGHDANRYADWIRRQLVFDSASVSAMLATVGRWYDYDFRLADTTLRSRQVSAVFNMSSQTETMIAIRELLDVTMTFDGRTVTLHPRSRGADAPGRTRDTLSPITGVGR
jgi:ferric-dicitrate binding protein FerR (iron transport regulator)